MDENHIETIFHRILEAIKPDQGPGDGFDVIFLALQRAISFQMALACSHCRKGLGRKLRANIPAMLTYAGQLQRSAQQEFGEHHTKH
jgi:hypothetical protein